MVREQAIFPVLKVLKYCKQNLSTQYSYRNGLLRPNTGDATSPLRGSLLNPVVKSPLRRTLEKAFLSKSTSHMSLPTTSSSSSSGGVAVEPMSENVRAGVGGQR